MLYNLQLGALATNCYILANSEKRAIVVDPGGSYPKFKAFMEENDLVVDSVLLTHGHYDHIGAVSAIKKDNPDVHIYINKEEELLYERYVRGEGLPPYMKPSDYKDFKPTDYIKGGDVLNLAGFEIKVLPCPGHTPGGVSFVTENYMFTGDTLFRGSMGRIDLLGGDKDEMMKSLKYLYEYEGDYIVLPGHEAATTLEEERQTNPYFRLAMK